MNEQKKQKLLEQYDDAAFALLMDEYAEEEGARLMAEFEAAQAAGQVPEMPAELDEQCRRMIRRDRAKKRGIRAARSFRKVAVKAAVAVLVFIGLMTTVVMSVDALRVPVLNYLINNHGEYFTFITPTTGSIENTFIELLPNGYEIVLKDVSENKSTYAYQDAEGSFLMYERMPVTDGLLFDSEDAVITDLTICGYQAHVIHKNGVRIVWINDDTSMLHSIYSTSLSEDDLISIAEEIAGGHYTE